MIYTFEITYKGIDDFNVIQFCAKTKNEAIRLFEEWCKTDNHTEPVPIESIEVVYNETDATEYGSNYGTPDTYTE